MNGQIAFCCVFQPVGWIMCDGKCSSWMAGVCLSVCIVVALNVDVRQIAP